MRTEDVTRKWYVVDADGRVLGRMATKLAHMLQGKHKPVYTPHVDTGDFIIVVNAKKVKLTGVKDLIKVYRHHTGYISGLREIPIARKREEKPEDIVLMAVRRMMPKTKLGAKMFSKLKVYGGPEHDHVAQKPEPLEI